MTTPTSQASTRLVLEGVPQVKNYDGGPRCPEDLTFPSCLRASLEYLGDKELGCKHCLAKNPDCKVFCSYSYLLGTSGCAAYLSWRPGWFMENEAMHNMSADPTETYRRAFASIGYTGECVFKEEGRDNETYFRQRIMDSLQKGLPAIAIGVVGPPEAAILTGYDEAGDVMLGWSFFQAFPEFNAGIEFEPSGYFRKRDWYKDTEFLILFGEKFERPSLDKIYRSALEWMLQVTLTPKVVAGGYERHNGLAAYTAWADHLLMDEAFPVNEEAVLREHHWVHEVAIGRVAEARWYGSQFLIEAANFVHYALAEDLFKAAGCYAAEHNLMWQVWDLEGGNGNPEAFRKVADPEVRRKMVPVILQARDKDAEAAQYIQQALSKYPA